MTCYSTLLWLGLECMGFYEEGLWESWTLLRITKFAMSSRVHDMLIPHARSNESDAYSNVVIDMPCDSVVSPPKPAAEHQ